MDVDGGAAIAAYRLHSGLRRRGYESSMYVRNRRSHDPTVIQYSGSRSSLAWQASRKVRDRVEEQAGSLGLRYGRCVPHWASLSYFSSTRPDGFDFFSDIQVSQGQDIIRQMPHHDIVNLHWISKFVDIKLLIENIDVTIPIVWTLHDMNPFTGGCHYAADCRKYHDRCGACPQLGSNIADDLATHIWQHKEHAFRQRTADNLRIVAPSRWLADEASRSTLLSRFPVMTIPYGLDIANFAPRDKYFAREILDLPQSARVLLFVAAHVNNRRKGFMLLLKALKRMAKRKDLYLLSLGQRADSLPAGIPYRHLDSITDERMISLIYSAADLSVVPSLEDNLPNTVLEAMACGTPVIGFSAGGLPDMVRPGITGDLVPVGDVAALQQAIEALLDSPERRDAFSVNCRRVVEQEYSSELQAKRYIALYEEMLHANGTCQ